MKPSPWCLLVLAFAVVACRLAAPVKLPTGDAGTPSAGAVVVCAHLRTLGCPEGDPSLKGQTCEDLVATHPFYLRTECVADSQSVDEVRECDVRCGASQ